MATTLPREPDLTPRQRWLAARRLAAGERVVVAACAAGVGTHSLRLVLKEDPDFIELVDAFRAIKALSPEEKRARLEDLCWDGAERAVLDGRVSTLNICVKGLRLLADPEADADDELDPLDAFYAGLSPEEQADYDGLDLPDEEILAASATEPRPTPEAEPAEAATATAPTPLLPLPTGTAPCAYGPADLSLPCPPRLDSEAPAAEAEQAPARHPAVPPAFWAAAPWQKPAGGPFPQRPP
jgi:hypothetical protein